jgi:DNA-binding NarL/FixJ family response regulator
MPQHDRPTSGSERPPTQDGPAVRVLLVDDDPLVCQGLELMLSSAPDLQVVAAVADGDEVVGAVHAHRPDVVLMDVRMQRMDGLSATRAVTAERHAPRVLVLTTFGDEDEALRAVMAGAAGFLLKTASPAEIIDGVRSVAAGQGAVSGRAAGQIFAHLAGDAATRARAEAAELCARLTDREREVAALVARGRANSQVATRLKVSPSTVKAHLSSIQDKLGCTGRVEIAVLAERAGLTRR